MNIKRERSEKADLIVSRLRKPEFVRTDLLVILALQETRSWNTDDLHVPGFIVYGSKFGLTTLLVSERVSLVQRSWCLQERFVAALLRRTLVMSVYALDAVKSLEDYEAFMGKVQQN